MDKTLYATIEAHMLACMRDAAHDTEHIYRVLYLALDIAAHEAAVDYDILLPACLLHDIGREKQFKNPEKCHAKAGAKMAKKYLLGLGYSEDRAKGIAACIKTHRYRAKNEPESLEAKILFDADKLDVTGVLGIIRSAQYGGHVGTPLYSTDGAGRLLDGSGEGEADSLLHEYHRKLKHLYGRFYTKRGAYLAGQRRPAAEAAYQALLCEAGQGRREGRQALEDILS